MDDDVYMTCAALLTALRLDAFANLMVRLG